MDETTSLPVTPLARIVTGSRSFGTAIPGSDTDVKGVHVPDAADILLQRIRPSERTTAPDHESYPLHRFLEMAAEGQPGAVEMLFSPPGLWIGEVAPLWHVLVENRGRLLAAGPAFSRYSARQARAFGGKSARLETVRAALGAVEAAVADHGPDARLEVALAALEALSGQGVAIVAKAGDPVQRMLTVGDKQIPLGAKLSRAREVLGSSLARFGERAQRASEGGGVDWKALMHALRLAEEGIEFHRTGAVTLPRPNAAALRAVRLGEVPLAEVEERIAAAAAELAAAEASSVVPAEADREWADALVAESYGAAVAEWVAAARPATGPAPG